MDSLEGENRILFSSLTETPATGEKRINITINMAILFQTGMKYFVKQCMIFSHLGTNSYNTYLQGECI